jgi:hypothetical protein
MICQSRLHLKNKQCKAKAVYNMFVDDKLLAKVCKGCVKPLYEACCPPYTIKLELIKNRTKQGKTKKKK